MLGKKLVTFERKGVQQIQILFKVTRLLRLLSLEAERFPKYAVALLNMRVAHTEQGWS